MKTYRIKTDEGVRVIRFKTAPSHVPTVSDCGNYAYAPSDFMCVFDDIGAADEIVRGINHTGWFENNFGETFRGHVWRLPLRTCDVDRDGDPRYGAARFIAGYTESCGSSYVVLDCVRGMLRLFDDAENAAHAGDELARIKAEQAVGYNERWEEASRANDERDSARDKLKAAHARGIGHIRALRELVARQDNARFVLLEGLDNAREQMHAAIREITEKTEEIESLGMTREFGS